MAVFTYRLQTVDAVVFADCCELALTGEGATSEQAVSSLRTLIAETFAEPNAMAPPIEPRTIEVLLVEAPAKPHASPQGPGEAMS
jgi:hypothetical protein